MINSLTKDSILDVINTQNKSGIFTVAKDFKQMLGRIEVDANGRIVAARAAMHLFFGKVNKTLAELQKRNPQPKKGKGVQLKKVLNQNLKTTKIPQKKKP